MHTGRVGYAEPLYGHAERSLLLFSDGGVYEEILKIGIEVKAGSGKMSGKMCSSYTGR